MPDGRDLPDVLPQIPATWQDQRLSAGSPCLGADLFQTLAFARVVLRLTVEADGRISTATVWRSSENAAYDNAIVCLLTTQLPPLEPAQSGGEAVPTDMLLLEVTGNFLE